MICPHCLNRGYVFLLSYRVRCDCPAGDAMFRLEVEQFGSPCDRVIPLMASEWAVVERKPVQRETRVTTRLYSRVH
jgi:hypothetical protein